MHESLLDLNTAAEHEGVVSDNEESYRWHTDLEDEGHNNIVAIHSAIWCYILLVEVFNCL